MTAERQLRFWLVGLALFLLAVYLLRGVLLPFVAGMAIAYLLDPACDRLEKWGCSRTLATVLVTAAFVLLVVAAVVVLAPMLQAQVVDLAARLPGYIETLRSRAAPLLRLLEERLSAGDLAQLRGAAGGQAGTVVAWIGKALGQLLSGGLALVDVLSLVFITPIVAFYLLRDWDRLVARIDGWLPHRHAAVIREQARLIDRMLAGFVRGQATVCLLLGLFYGIGLSLIGLDFGLAVGLFAGFLSFVPFLGSIVGFVAGVGLALAQFSDWLPVVGVAALFVVGQAIEGNLLTPKLVGDRVGLHPVWVIFAVLAGGLLFGFVGVLLALPMAAVVGVLARFALQRYLASRYYGGGDAA